jgi:hypothetical protein
VSDCPLRPGAGCEQYETNACPCAAWRHDDRLAFWRCLGTVLFFAVIILAAVFA